MAVADKRGRPIFFDRARRLLLLTINKLMTLTVRFLKLSRMKSAHLYCKRRYDVAKDINRQGSERGTVQEHRQPPSEKTILHHL